MSTVYQRRNDPRIMKTELSLRFALFSCLQDEPLDHLTVAKITAASQVTRGTFYQHYASKDDFIHAVELSAIDEFIAAVTVERHAYEDAAPRMSLDSALNYLRDPQHGFAIMFRRDDNTLSHLLRTELGKLFHQYLMRVHGELVVGDVQIALINLCTLLTVSVFHDWSLALNGWDRTQVLDILRQSIALPITSNITLEKFFIFN